MFIDASAVVAILHREPGSDELAKRLAASDKPPLFSPLARYEAVVSLARSRSGKHKAPDSDQFEAAKAAVDLFFQEARAKSVMISDTLGAGALAAAQSYGKAVGHEADLNFGDCFSYACAKGYRVALLYKGNDFSKTDLA